MQIDSLDISSVEAVYDGLLAKLPDSAVVSMDDLVSVDRVDTAGLQLLFALDQYQKAHEMPHVFPSVTKVADHPADSDGDFSLVEQLAYCGLGNVEHTNKKA